MAARGCLLLSFLILTFNIFAEVSAVTYYIPFPTTPTTSGTSTSSTICGTNQYFDVAGLRCRSCDATSQEKTQDGLLCQCKPSFKTLVDVGGPSESLQCEACLPGQVTTADGWNCIDCETDCSPCDATDIGEEYTITGALLPTKICQTCDATALPNTDGNQCERCHQSFLTNGADCLCSDPNVLANGLCFAPGEVKTQRSDTFQVSFEALDSPVTSEFFSENLLAAEAMCRVYKNLTSCQLLGNLCVLLNYNPSSDTDACHYYGVIRLAAPPLIPDNVDWGDYIPWLLYITDTAEEVLTEIDIPIKYSADPQSDNSKLLFYVAQYNATGHYLGLEPITGGVLQFCDDAASKLDAAYNFATTYSSSCKLKAQDLWSYGDPVFYDMYLRFTDQGSTSLYAVPVLLDNFKDGDTYQNQKVSNIDWQLTRRFFLVDTLSGKVNNQPAVAIRYASSIEIVVTLQNIEGEPRDGKIYPPLLKITYSDLVYEDDYDTNTEVTVSFRVTYTMNRDYYEVSLSTAMGIISGFGIVWALVRANAWRRRAGLIYIDVKSMFKFFFFMCGTLGNVFFTCIFGTCVYWLLFFKYQDEVSLVLPTPDQEVSFIWYLCFAFAFKAMDMLHLVIYQSLTDIFLVDWERSRGRVVQSSDSANKGSVAPVSIWRTYFVANEWNELQEMRRSSVVFQLLSMLFFLEVVGMKYWTTTDPRSSIYVDSSTYIGEYSRVMRFGVAAGLYLILSFAQWIFFAFIYERFVEDSMRNFVDLCSMANISVFVLTDNSFGYYIHGRSVHGFADTGMKEMRNQLKREEDNLCGQRGLLPNSDQQTFEMLLPLKFREQYNTILQSLDGVGARIDGTRGRPDVNRSQETDRTIQAYQTMNKFLAAFLDHGIRDIDYVVKDKLLLEQILDMEFYDPAEKGFFYNDGGHSFDSTLFYGNESSIQLFELLLFCIIDLMAVDFILSAIITFIGSMLILKIRAGAGRANLAKKTLVDERFLI